MPTRAVRLIGLDFVLTDIVRLIEQLRNAGRKVLLHCLAAQSRTPTVALHRVCFALRYHKTAVAGC
jgi:hypothetical protein